MKKYYIGIAIICLVTLGFVGYVGYQGLSGKQDAESEKKAEDIAKQLNKYVDTEQKIPESLDEVGAKDVPDTIKYTKKSDQEYTFCVTYKMASSYDFSDPVTALSGAALGGGLSNSNYYDDIYNNELYPAESLYLYGPHKKGENCQTIKPYLGGNSPYEDPYYYDYKPSSSPGTSKNADDTERQTDIKALHGQVEAFYAQNGYYPTLENLNDSSFRSANMKGLDAETLKDPDGKTYKLVAAPVAGAYVYTVTPPDCDNSTGNECLSYTLTATLKDGTIFSKTALN